MTPSARIAAAIDLLEAVESSTRSADATANDFFRAGKSGQWRNVLTSDQAQKITAAHGDVMRSFGYLDGAK